jgi:serine-type D-Ala-D-Ala carboxypeptidase (penicillin-binding protein 5/6)
MRAARVATAALALALGLLAPTHGASAASREPQPAAEAWVLVDARDAERLAADDAAAERSIASATKLMTAYLALEEDRDRRIAAPAYQPAAASESLLGLEAGERISYRDLVYSLILASANDGAVAVAEGVSGSVARFVRAMNRAAADLGLDGTSFANPIGLDEPGNHSTAIDLAELTSVLLEDPFFRRVADTTEHTVRTDRAAHSIVTRNDLLLRAPYVTGVKTGYTIEAQNVLVGSGERKGVRLIAVVLGAPTEAARDDGVLSLLDYGFSLYRRATPIERAEVVARPEVDSGGTIRLVAERPLRVTARRDQQVETTVDAPAELTGPIRKGERVGRARVAVDGRVAGTVPLVAASSAPAAGIGDDVRDNAVALALAGGLAVVILIAILLVLRARRADRSGEMRGIPK